MTGSLVGLLAANVLFAAVGVGALPLLRVARTWSELIARAPLAYPLGVAATGILAGHLALLGVAVGLVELVLLAAVALLLGVRRLSGTETRRATSDEPAWSVAVGGVALAVAGVLVAHAWRTYELRPLLEWDGWAIWGTRARGLYEFGGATGPVFTSESYLPLQHPLLLPSLEAIDFRAMSAFDPTLVHVQLALLALGFVLGLVTLLRGLVPDALIGLGVLAIVAAEPVLKQLSTNLADVPLAFFVALGLAGIGRWLARDDGWALVVGAVFLGAAALTKNEGALFALTALVAAVPAARGRLRAFGAAALAVALIFLPWRLNVSLRDLPLVEYELGNALSPSYLADHADRVGPALDGLGGEILSLEWGLLAAAFVVATAAALLARRYALASFAALWVALSFLGLLVVYWISTIPIELALVWSGDRTVVSLVVGAATLAVLLAGDAYRRGSARNA